MTCLIRRAGVPIAALALFAGCINNGGSQPIPAVFPSDIELAIDELPDDSGGASRAKSENQSNLIAGLLAFNRTVRTTTAVVNGFHLLTGRALAVAAQIQNDITDADNPIVEGTIIHLGDELEYIADFSAFDIDGDGTPDGSGRADTEPVAVRLCIDRGEGFQRFLCALITTRPTDENLGAGQMYIHPAAANDDAVDTLQIYVNYDRTDDAHKWNEAVVQGRIRPGFVMNGGRHRVDVREDENGVIGKTVRSTTNFAENTFGFENFQCAVTYQVGGVSALLSGESTGGSTQVGFENVCVTIDTDDQNEKTDGSCAELDTQDFSFVAATTAGEADFPAAFSECPDDSDDDDDDDTNGSDDDSDTNGTDDDNNSNDL